MTLASTPTKRTRPKRVTVWALYLDTSDYERHHDCKGVFTSRAKADKRVSELQAKDNPRFPRTYIILPQTLNAATDWSQP